MASDRALELLEAEPSGNVTPRQASEFAGEAVASVDSWMPWLETALEGNADELLEQHRTAREAAGARGRFRVEALKPIDVLGLYVLLPDLR
jgi:hypothetical protein